MNLLHKNRIEASEPDQYATSEDFRKLFAEGITGLYLLSFLLTGDQEKAEHCFVAGFEDCVKANSIFKEWARSWAQRAIIQNAIRAMAPRANHSSAKLAAVHPENNTKLRNTRDKNPEIESVLALGDFERFVFVMSVLEGYSDHDCFVLLGCSPQDVRQALARALQQIVESTAKRSSPEGDQAPVPTGELC